MHLRPGHGRSLFACALLVVASLLTPALAVVAAPSAPVVHAGRLVPQRPRVAAPYVGSGQVRDFGQVDDTVYVAGTFTQVHPTPPEPAVAQQGIYAYARATGALDRTFRPAVAGDVLTVLPSADGRWLYLGGRFSQVGTTTVGNVARVDARTGVLDPDFVVTTDGPVGTLTAHDGTLWLGGSFSQVNGVRRGSIAAVDAASGELTASEVWSDETFSPTMTVATLRVTPDGETLVIAHAGDRVGTTIDGRDLTGGEFRRGVAMVDLRGGPGSERLLPFRARTYERLALESSRDWTVQDMELAPDGTYVVVAHAGSFRGTSYNDSVVRFDLASRDDASAEPAWVTQMWDSSFAVAISDAAVYVGGHFCFVAGPDAVSAPPRDGLNRSCYLPKLNRAPNAAVHPGQVVRNQLAALDPATGRALADFNPGSDGQKGVTALEVVPAGLLVGHDGTILGREDVGRAGLLDLDVVPTERNLAQDAAATLSSTATDLGMLLSADRAVDGNVANGPLLAWLATTELETDPYLDIDLGSVQDVARLRVFGRNDCCDDLRTQLSVAVSSTPFTGPSTEATAATPGATVVTSVVAAPRTWTVDVGRPVRYVRVQRDCTCVLTLREVEVLAGDPGGDTVAPTLTALARTDADGAVVVEGRVTDGVGVHDVRLAVRDLTTGHYLGADGTFGTSYALFPASAQPTVGATADSWQHVLPTDLGEGTYRVFPFVRDLAGNTAGTTVQVVVGDEPVNGPTDGIAPKVVVQEAGAVDGVVTIAGEATDRSGVTAVRVAIRDVASGGFLDADGIAQPEFALLTAELDDPGATRVRWSYTVPESLATGDYRVQVLVTDAGGNTGRAFREVIVERGAPVGTPPVVTPPVVTPPVVTPPAELPSPDRDDVAPAVEVLAAGVGLVEDGLLSASGRARDAEGIAEVLVAVRREAGRQYVGLDGEFTDVWTLLPATMTGGPGEVAWTLTVPDALPSGTYRVLVHARDLAGNVGVAVRDVVVVASRPPAGPGGVPPGPGDPTPVDPTPVDPPVDPSGPVPTTVPTPPAPATPSSPDTAPTVIVTAPGRQAMVGRPVTVVGTALDDRGVVSVELAVRNLDTRDWYDADGRVVPEWQLFPVQQVDTGSDGRGTSVRWSTELPGSLPDGRYRAFPVVRDATGALGTDHVEFILTSVDASSDTDAPTIDVRGIELAERADGSTTTLAPGSDGTVRPGATLRGRASDDVAVVRVEVALRNLATGSHVRTDGSIAEVWTSQLVTDAGAGADLRWTHALPTDLAEGDYRAFFTAIDAAGRSATTVSELRVEAAGPRGSTS